MYNNTPRDEMLSSNIDLIDLCVSIEMLAKQRRHCRPAMILLNLGNIVKEKPVVSQTFVLQIMGWEGTVVSSRHSLQITKSIH